MSPTIVFRSHTFGVVDGIAARIREVLDARRWSERELSARAGLAPVHVGKILDRGGSRAGGETLAKIAKAAGVSLEWLVTGEGPRDLETRVEYTDDYPARAPLLAALRSSGDPFDAAVLAELKLTTYSGAENLTLSEWIEEAAAAAGRIRRREAGEKRGPDARALAHIAEQDRVRRDELGERPPSKPPPKRKQ